VEVAVLAVSDGFGLRAPTTRLRAGSRGPRTMKAILVRGRPTAATGSWPRPSRGCSPGDLSARREEGGHVLGATKPAAFQAGGEGDRARPYVGRPSTEIEFATPYCLANRRARGPRVDGTRMAIDVMWRRRRRDRPAAGAVGLTVGERGARLLVPRVGRRIRLLWGGIARAVVGWAGWAVAAVARAGATSRLDLTSAGRRAPMGAVVRGRGVLSWSASRCSTRRWRARKPDAAGCGGSCATS